jgi:DNA-binding transcriptional MerR regulator
MAKSLKGRTGGGVKKRVLVPVEDLDIKASDAFRTISEVSVQLDVPKHVLRFWEGRFSQLKPMKRGGGRRFYRPEDIELLVGIRQLLHVSGYTIRGVQQLLRKNGVDWVKQAGTGQVSVPVRPADAGLGESHRREQLTLVIEEVRQCLAVLGVARADDAGEGRRGRPERKRA